MNLTAYFDESGTHAGCPAMTVAGWLSVAPQWKKFNKQWKVELENAGVTYFHMTDYENKQGPYKNWTTAKRIKVLSTLHKIVRDRTIIPISASVPIKDYDGIRHNYAEPNSPYIFCVLQCLVQIETWADKNAFREKIDYFFERGAGFGNELNALFRKFNEDIVRQRRFRIGRYAFGDKKELLQLQAADMLAYESNKEMLNCIIPGDELHPLRKSALSLVKGKNSYCVYFGKDALEAAVRKLGSPA